MIGQFLADAISGASVTATKAATATAHATAKAGASVTAAITASAAPVDAVTTATINSIPHTGFQILLNQIEYFIVVPMVYLAILFCIVMIVVRIVQIFQAPAQPYSLKIFPVAKRPGWRAVGDAFLMPTVKKHKPLFWVFLMIFHVAFLLLILGHFDLLPQISILPESSKHMLGWGLVGVGVTVPLFYFFIRRFKTPNREISVPADYILLLLVIFLALFGDLMSWGNSWTATGFVITKQGFANYFRVLTDFSFVDPRTFLSGTHYHFLVIHVFLANLFFIVLPFTKIMHSFFAIPINMLRRK
jgi:nitrate reductase gamma subunit